MHKNAPGAHAAAEAAHQQGKFWEMHDKIFANQRALNYDQYVKYASELGMNVEKFEKDFRSPTVKNRVDGDSKEAAGMGVTGTPGFFLNGKFFSGAKSYDSFKKLIDEELARAG